MSQELVAKYKSLKAQRRDELAAVDLPISSPHWLDGQIEDIENTLFN